MKVNEMFYSIQGESTYTGLPCMFIRLAGCNLRCSYCDTNYALKESDGEDKTIEEIVEWARGIYEETGCNLIEVTGGEPLLQAEELIELCEELNNEINAQILIETNGSVNLENIKLSTSYTTFIMDVKTPSSKMHTQNILENLNLLCLDDEVKFVVGSQEDLEFMTEVLTQYDTDAQILVSPIWGAELKWDEIAEYIKYHHPQIRMQIQMHKLIWKPEERGV